MMIMIPIKSIRVNKDHMYIYIYIHMLYYFEDNISEDDITVRYISNIP